jgi:hypothetical protein
MMDLREIVEKGGDADLLREMIGFAAERLMELEVGAKAGTGYGEKGAERLAQRNGLSYDFPRLLCDKGAAARHPKYAGQRRGTDREWVGHLGPCGSVIAPVFSHDLNG